jgi:hypothetical protein
VDPAPAPILREVPRLARYDENGEYKPLTPSTLESTRAYDEMKIGQNGGEIVNEERKENQLWTFRRKLVVWGGGGLLVIILIVVIVKGSGAYKFHGERTRMARLIILGYFLCYFGGG